MAGNAHFPLIFLLEIAGLHTQPLHTEPLRQGPDGLKTADTRRVVVGKRHKPRAG